MIVQELCDSEPELSPDPLAGKVRPSTIRPHGPTGNRSPRGDPGPGGRPVTDAAPEQRFAVMLEEFSQYPQEAYAFLFDALDHSVRHVHCLETHDLIETGEIHHVEAQELLESVRQFAILEFGCLAGCVFESWGIDGTEDIGAMVFNLIEHQLLGKKDSDQIDDFDCGFGGLSFNEVFAIEPQLEYCQEKDEWIASYRSAS